ncbi:DoxX family protein [Chryseolinea sp. T2]|uniref:DoxX family protein n=1 Tax=Chryseolinea sp. T2 TaxID=3129255 RepID=UPI00307898CD
MSNIKVILSWLLRLTAAFIMVQSLFFKFSGAEESVYIFSKLGMEPWGRIGTGVAELIASVLLIIPRTTWLGAALGLGTISGAIFFHLTSLGIEVMNDGGQLFIYALITAACCLILLLMEREKVQTVIHSTFSR